MKDVNRRGIGIILFSFLVRKFKNFTQGRYKRSKESGYIISKFIILGTRVKRDSRIKQVRVNDR